MKEFENLTVRGFKGSNVLVWHSLPVTETSKANCIQLTVGYSSSLMPITQVIHKIQTFYTKQQHAKEMLIRTDSITDNSNTVVKVILCTENLPWVRNASQVELHRIYNTHSVALINKLKQIRLYDSHFKFYASYAVLAYVISSKPLYL